jgi:hypothetical protein
VALLPGGVVLTDHLANEILHVKPGDMLTVEVLEGRRPVLQVPVLGITKQYLGVSAYMQQDSLNALMREGGMFLNDDWLGTLSGITPAMTEARRDAFGQLKKRSLRDGGRIQTNVYQVLANYKAQAAVYAGKQESIMRIGKMLADREFQQMDPGKRADVLRYMRAELEQADDRYRARANAQTPEKLIAFGEALEEVRANPAMSPTEITGKYGTTLGREFTSRLIGEAKELSGKAKAFSIDRDLLQGEIPQALRKPKSREDEQKLKTYNSLVERTLIDWKAANPGKMPTKDEQLEIARSANKEYVEIGRIWNSTRPAYAVKPDMKAVPKDFYEQSQAWAKAKGKAISDEEILQAWQKQKGKK